MNAFAARFHVAGTPSPLVDRRALSQAWYDALHLASREPRCLAGAPETRAGTTPLSNARFSQSPCHPERSAPQAPGVEGPRHSSGSKRPPALASAQHVQERRAPSSRLARCIASKVKENAAVSRFVIEHPNGRVLLHVVRGGEGVKMVAFCPTGLRADVERALAQARFALAATGGAVR